MDYKQKSKIELKAVCPDCGLVISDKAESNVTRYLAVESRCTCKQFDPSNNADEAINQDAMPTDFSGISANLPDRYEIQSLLGQGGIGAVYKVWDHQLQKTFAIKMLNANLVEDKSSQKRFEQEARAARDLTSANLAAVYDFGMGQKSSPYIVMDYLDGISLDVLLADQGSLDVPRAQDIFVQICEAITHAHTKGVVHRDIKPSNIMLTRSQGGSDVVKLVDFGIAKVLPSRDRATQNLTQTGDIFGSPVYMSPEQCLGNPLDARSDIYGFGCVMYETLTGQPPFNAENSIKIILKHINEEPVDLRRHPNASNVNASLAAVIMRCLAKDPAERYQSADRLLQDLQDIQDGKSIRLDETKKHKGERWHQKQVSRRQVSAIIAGMTVLGAFASIPIFLMHSSPSSSPAPPAVSSISDPIRDANDFDNKSYQYFVNRDYEKAIPLLQFGLSAYKSRGPYYLADNYQHIGKCYKELGKLKTAVPYYEKALKIYGDQKKIHGPGYGLEAEARSDYAAVLIKLGQSDKAKRVADGSYTPDTVIEPAPNVAD